MTQPLLGKDDQDREAVLIHLQNNKGLRVTLTNFGARLVSILVPDREGQTVDVCLGYDSLRDYQTKPGYLGATIGRWGNRIAGASFTLNGQVYTLYANDGGNTLHGGREGFDQKFWTYDMEGEQAVTFSYTSPHGEEGFPGELHTQVRFEVFDDGRLSITYRADTDRDTVVNLTNHAYFNLAGGGTIHEHLLQVQANSVAEVREDLIPTGNLVPVSGTPYDLRQPTRLGERLAMRGQNAMFDSAQGFDIDYVLLGEGFRQVAVLSDPASGRVMRVMTDQPGLQVYSGQGLQGPAKGGVVYQPYSGIALETQHHPDSPNHPNFPSTLLRAGLTYNSTTVYQFLAE
ncbi:MAG: galactose mutarotase [Clostridiales bacterium]|nr:galactose mutarotase [Clostridiales bacterium]